MSTNTRSQLLSVVIGAAAALALVGHCAAARRHQATRPLRACSASRTASRYSNC